MPEEAFSIRIEGHTSEVLVTPSAVSAGDLAHLVALVEKAVLGMAPKEALPAVALSVVAIRSGSNVLVWKADPAVHDAIAALVLAIQVRDFKRLSGTVRKDLRELWRMSQRLNWRIGFLRTGFSPDWTAVISPDHEIPSLPETRGVTTIYGQCIRVGGEGRATAKIRLLNGKVITATMSEQIAKRLARRLYAEVALEGEALWSEDDFEILQFRAERLLPYQPVSPEEAFRRLREAGGDAWDAIDAMAYIQDLRAD